MRCGKSEIEDLDQAAGRHKDILGFEIPVHDVLFVGSHQASDDLPGDLQGLRDSHLRTFHAFAERFTFQQLHYSEGHTILGSNVVDREDVRVRESCDASGFPFESGMRLGILGEMVGEDLDGDVPVEPCVSGTIHLTHSTGAQQLADRIWAEIRAFLEFHISVQLRKSISWYTILNGCRMGATFTIAPFTALTQITMVQR